MALLLALARKIPFRNARTHAGTWEMKAVVPIHRLRGTSSGLSGIRPDSAVNGAQSEGVRHEGRDLRSLRSAGSSRQRADVERVEFDELMKISDYISIHTPLMPATHHLFNAESFSRMKPTAT